MRRQRPVTTTHYSPVYDCHEVNYPERGPEDQVARGGDDCYEVGEGGGARHVLSPSHSLTVPLTPPHQTVAQY